MMASRVIVVDDTDSRIQYDGSGWFQHQGSRDTAGSFGPAYRSTLHGTKTNASLSFNFSGTKVTVYGSNNIRNDSGVLDPRWECFIDHINIGKTAPYSVAENHWIFCEQDQLVDGPHVITVNATVLKEQTFWFDEFQYTPSTSVPLDNEAIQIDNLDPAMHYGDGWAPLGTIANFTQNTNTNFTFSFIGVSLSWYSSIPVAYPHTTALGSYSVDGQIPINFSLKGLPARSTTTIFNQKFFETPEYPAGPHTIVVTYLGDSSMTPLSLDYLIVQNGTVNSSTSSSETSTPNSSGAAGPKSTGSNHSSDVGFIVGGVVGGLVLIGLAILVTIYFRRRGRKQGAMPIYDHHEDRSNVVEPFHPSRSDRSVPVSYYRYAPASSGAGDTAQHASKASQITTNSNAIIPPSSVSVRNPPLASSSHQLPSSSVRPNNVYFPPTVNNQSTTSQSHPLHPDQQQHRVMAQKARREAEATAAVLRPQRSPQILPEAASSASGSGRLIVHEDSGLRLQRPESDVVEIPPMYTAG